MAELTIADWAAGTTDPDVASILNAITLPASLTSSEFLYKTLAAYRTAQETWNTANTNDPINSMSLPSTGGVTSDDSGNLSFLTSSTYGVKY
ncbi:MAG: hypothetical protein AAFO04_30180 [Cyanobacteria bacterium J06592_8]